MSPSGTNDRLSAGLPPRRASSRAFDWVLKRAFGFRLPPLTAAGLTTAVIVAVGVVRAWLFAGNAPWFLFVPAVLVLSLLLGRAMGALATVLSALIAAFAVWQPEARYLLSPVDWTATLVFLATTLGVVALAGELRAAFALRGSMIAQREADVARMSERESFLASVLASSPDCIKVLDLEGRLAFMSEGGMNVMEVSDFNAVRGCPWPDFWAGKGNAEAQAAVAAARRGEMHSFVGAAETMAGTPKWWSVAVSPIFGPDGRPERILSVSRDITAFRTNEEARERLAHLVEASTDFIVMCRADGRVFFLNDAARRLIGLSEGPVEALTLADFCMPADAQRLGAEVLPASAAGQWSGELRFRHLQTGEPVPVLGTVFPIREGGGPAAGYGLVARDFRERLRAEAQREVLKDELSHRLKNTLTLVQAIADQTLRAAGDREAVQAFMRRLHTLGSAHEVLLLQDWQAAPMLSVVTSVLVTFGPFDRFDVSGPEVRLGPRTALSIALLLHELATNALKYGALSRGAGRVSLAWSVEDAAGEPAFRLNWRETGGPPALEPARRGFGSRLIRSGLVGTGGVELRYLATGFEADMTAPLAHVEEA